MLRANVYDGKFYSHYCLSQQLALLCLAKLSFFFTIFREPPLINEGDINCLKHFFATKSPVVCTIFAPARKEHSEELSCSNHQQLLRPLTHHRECKVQGKLSLFPKVNAAPWARLPAAIINCVCAAVLLFEVIVKSFIAAFWSLLLCLFFEH